jgi:hypothetical protein
MHTAGRVLFLFLFALAIIAYVSWAASDARERGKSAVLVCLAVTFFFPMGLLAWLLFRPGNVA